MTESTSTRVGTAERPDGDVLLEVRGLEVHFPIRSGIVLQRTVGHVRAVDGIDLDVRRGTTLGLVGESGCGKSTFGRAVLRLVEPTGGTVRFDGVDLTTLKGEQLRKARRRMQMVFQDPMASLDPRQDVESLLVEPMRAHGLEGGASAWRARVRELLDLVGLPASAAAKYPHEFSGGQRQRIGIARAIALEPELVIADEPVSALDVSVQAQVVNLLEELQQRLGLTYVVIAHDLAVVRHISDEIGVMYLGSLVEQSPSEELYTSAPAPVHDQPHLGDPRARPGGRGPARAHPARRRPAVAGEPAVRLPVPHPLPVPPGDALPRRGAGPARAAPGHRVACHWAEDVRDGRITAAASSHDPTATGLVVDQARTPGV